MASSRFWKTQPVPQFYEPDDGDEGPIKIIEPQDIKPEPEELPNGFEWSTLDAGNPQGIDELYELLFTHREKCDVALLFGFEYSRELLSWALKPPGWKKEWHVAVRLSGSKQLVACICGVPLTIRIRRQRLPVSVIRILYIHPHLRNRRLTPVLIREITRRCYSAGVYQALYMTDTVLPTPINTSENFVRRLDTDDASKLSSPLSFLFVPVTKSESSKFALPSDPELGGLRPMQPSDLHRVHSLFHKYLSRFDLAPEPSEEDSHYWLLPGEASHAERIVRTYVIEDPETKVITDFVSFYMVTMPSLWRTDGDDDLRTAVLSYYASDWAWKQDDEQLGARLTHLVCGALIFAKREHCGSFVALDICNNPLFLSELQFDMVFNWVHHYLFNYRTAQITGAAVSLSELADDRTGGISTMLL